MRKYAVLVLILAVAGCELHHQERLPPEQIVPKTSVDVALQCLETLTSCEDWEPQDIPGLPPQDCGECREYDSDCEWKRDRCRERNRENGPSKSRSICQAKAETCIRLVEATSPEREIHHH